MERDGTSNLPLHITSLSLFVVKKAMLAARPVGCTGCKAYVGGDELYVAAL